MKIKHKITRIFPLLLLMMVFIPISEVQKFRRSVLLLLVVNLSEKYNKTYHEELLSRLNIDLNYVYSNWAGR